MAFKKAGASIKYIHRDEPLSDGIINVYLRDNGEYSIDAQMGSHRCGMETDRNSIVELRDALNEILGE